MKRFLVALALSTGLLTFAAPLALAQVVPAGSVDEGGYCYSSDPDSGNSDCAGNLACINNRCAVDNQLDSSGFGTQNGAVAPGGACAYNADCADQGSVSYSCINSVCSPDEGTVSSGGQCTENADCAGELACISGVCQVDTQLNDPYGIYGSNGTGSTASPNAPGSPYTTGACFGQSDCNTAAGYTCNTSTDTCVQGSGLNGATGGTGITPTSGTTGTGGINTAQLQGYETSIVGVINGILVPLLVAVAFIVFLWGVFNYFIRGAAEPEKRKEGAQFVLWGLVGFVIIFSVWGLVNLLLGTLSLTGGGTHQAYPTL